MKHAIVILDGAAGWPAEELGGLTSLQRARTPNLDRMAAEGTSGMALTVPPGEEPSSSAACMSILGYDPSVVRIGRGAIEAASLGITLAADEVALRMNLVTIADGRMRSYAAGHISTAESRAIVAELAEALGDETFRLHAGVAYRHILVVEGHPELMACAYTPPHDISDRPVAGEEPRGAGAEALLGLMGRARPVLAASEVNRRRIERGDLAATDIWPFWPGVAPRGVPSFSEMHRGVRAAMTSGVDLLNGLAVLFGIDRLAIAGVTDGHDNDYAAQARGAVAALEDHDLVVVHVESPDEAGHGGDAATKVAAIEAIDREVVGPLLDLGGVRVLAMPDHPTPLALRTHVGEPVPFVLWGPGVEPNGAAGYDESRAAGTGLTVDPGRDVLGLLLG